MSDTRVILIFVLITILGVGFLIAEHLGVSEHWIVWPMVLLTSVALLYCIVVASWKP